MEYPRVLVISNVPFSTTGNTGRTMAGLFDGWEKDKLAQLYFRDEIPDYFGCINYYRFSDVDAVKSIVQRWRTGKCVSAFAKERTDDYKNPVAQNIYSFAYANRNPLITILRDFAWQISSWKSAHLVEWIRKFQPDVIFFPMGDGVFAYKIAYWVSRKFDIPIVTMCYDDFLLGYNDKKGVLHRYKSSRLNHWAHKVIDGAPYLLTICRSMSEKYKESFHTRCVEMYSASAGALCCNPGESIAYFGNIGLGRWEQLVSIGKTLRELGHAGVDVYSQETIPDILCHMTEENGIRFHGSISYDEVQEKMAAALAVIHTESFNADFKERVRYSVSTKVADLLASGVCPLVYGPEDIASIQYFIEHDAGCVITRKEQLREKLEELLGSEQLRKKYIANAQKLAQMNHDRNRNHVKLCHILQSAADRGKRPGAGTEKS